MTSPTQKGGTWTRSYIICFLFFFAFTKFVYYFQPQMGTLQSRLDAEFLLSHMCSVKFKEWIVVLVTLLRRSEVRY